MILFIGLQFHYLKRDLIRGACDHLKVMSSSKVAQTAPFSALWQAAKRRHAIVLEKLKAKDGDNIPYSDHSVDFGRVLPADTI